MYRDRTLIPTEAIRVLALGLLADRDRRYADLANEVRQFASRIVGPSLDILGTSLELLRYEGLAEPVEGRGLEDNALLAITDRGRAELDELIRARVRAPVDDINKLVVALKMRFLHLLDPAGQREQAELLVDMCETELGRLEDLLEGHRDEPGHLAVWLEHDTAQLRARIDWLRRFGDSLDGAS